MTKYLISDLISDHRLDPWLNCLIHLTVDSLWKCVEGPGWPFFLRFFSVRMFRQLALWRCDEKSRELSRQSRLRSLCESFASVSLECLKGCHGMIDCLKWVLFMRWTFWSTRFLSTQRHPWWPVATGQKLLAALRGWLDYLGKSCTCLYGSWVYCRKVWGVHPCWPISAKASHPGWIAGGWISNGLGPHPEQFLALKSN